MDKETLSNYGWVVIVVIVLAIMIVLATPFGNYIAKGTTGMLKQFSTDASIVVDSTELDAAVGTDVPVKRRFCVIQQ